MQHLKKKILLIILTLFFTNSQAGVGDKVFTLTQNYSDEEIERRIEEKLILSYKDIPQLNYIKGEDKKEGRSLFDRPDVSEDYQIHFIYLLDKKSKIRNWILMVLLKISQQKLMINY